MNYCKLWSFLSLFIFTKYVFPFNFFILKWLSNCEDVHFTGKMSYLKGYNIFAKGVHLGGTFFQDLWEIHIGKWTIFWYENMILTAGYKDTNNLLRDPKVKSVTIWTNCWITSRVIILWWVSIGDNVTIWAWSVVTKDIPSNTFAAWNPCKLIRYL